MQTFYIMPVKFFLNDSFFNNFLISPENCNLKLYIIQYNVEYSANNGKEGWKKSKVKVVIKCRLLNRFIFQLCKTEININYCKTNLHDFLG